MSGMGLRSFVAAIAVSGFTAIVVAQATVAPAREETTAARFAFGTWLDLTHPFDAATIYWPTEKGFQFEPGNNGPNPKGYYYAANRFATAEHGGTHLDAPRHFAEGRHTADQIELERLVGAAAVPLLRFSGLAPERAKWLVEHRRVKAVGIDTASIDHGPSTLFGSHVVLCKADTPIFENLAGLDPLPEEGAFVVALPMKNAGGSGGPLRVLARLPDDE